MVLVSNVCNHFCDTFFKEALIGPLFTFRVFDSQIIAGLSEERGVQVERYSVQLLLVS